MGFITESIRGRGKATTGEATRDELLAHHCYGEDILADGFISPLVLPFDRLQELKGTSSVIEMANICHLPTREMELLLNYDYIEPTARQLMSISRAYHVSVLWLLGYHTSRDKSLNSHDGAMLAVIGKRNAAESARNRVTQKGALSDIFRLFADARVRKYNLQVSNTAARIIATEHLPLSEKELCQLNGQPVYVEYTAGGAEWGLVVNDTILTPNMTLELEKNGDYYKAYQTPGRAQTLHGSSADGS